MVSFIALLCCVVCAPVPDPAEAVLQRDILRELRELKARVAALEAANQALRRELDVERLVVRKELIVSDTGLAWERGYERQQIPRGIYARSLWDGPGGLWVRSRLIKAEVDDPFDDRFHAIERDGTLRLAPGHISWCVWLDNAWRQMAIVQGEGLDPSEVPASQWGAATHPGRIRLQTYRPGHDEPLTDALIGQGMMSLGGGGYGGGGLPFPREVLQVWGGAITQAALQVPSPPRVLRDDGSGAHDYAIVAVGPQGTKSVPSPPVHASGFAALIWDSQPGADAYILLRDGREVTGPLQIEGSTKRWADPAMRR